MLSSSSGTAHVLPGPPAKAGARRAAAVTANLARASDQLATAAEGIDALFAAARDVTTIISRPVQTGRARCRTGHKRPVG
jgi:hypothetical protein